VLLTRTWYWSLPNGRTSSFWYGDQYASRPKAMRYSPARFTSVRPANLKRGKSTTRTAKAAMPIRRESGGIRAKSAAATRNQKLGRSHKNAIPAKIQIPAKRSEERRVGKECRCQRERSQ